MTQQGVIKTLEELSGIVLSATEEYNIDNIETLTQPWTTGAVMMFRHRSKFQTNFNVRWVTGEKGFHKEFASHEKSFRAAINAALNAQGWRMDGVMYNITHLPNQQFVQVSIRPLSRA